MTWLEIVEVANLENVSKRAIEKRLSAGIYRTKQVPGRGGKKGRKTLIHFDSLSIRAKDRYFKSIQKNDLQENPEADFLEGLSEAEFKEYNRKVRTLQEVEEFPRVRLGRQEKMRELAEKEGITYMTLTRWLSIYNKEGLRGLVHKNRSDKGKIKIHDKVQKEIIRLYFYESKPSISQVCLSIKSYCSKEKIPVPHYSTIGRFVNDWERANPQDAHAHRHGIKAAQQKYGIYIPRDFNYLAPNDLWMADHSPMDILVINPATKKPDRPWLSAWLDVRTRTVMGNHISFQPSSSTIALALKNGICKQNYYGIPRVVYFDNGKDFRAKMFGGRLKKFGKIDFNEETKSVFSTLGIQVTYAMPYNPQAKAQIERWFGTLERGWINLLPGYTGHNVQHRPDKLDNEIKSGKLLSLIQFKEKLADAIQAYHARPHTGLNGKAPLELFMEKWEREDRIDTTSLSLLLLRKDNRQVSRDGIRINGLRYYSWDPDFMEAIGKEALIRWDPDDPTKINVTVNGKNLGWIQEATAIRFGDKEAMKTAIKIQKDQSKRWRRQVQKTEEERKEIDKLLWAGQTIQQVEVDQAVPEKKILHMTGLEQEAEEEKKREKRKKKDVKPEKLYRFEKGVI